MKVSQDLTIGFFDTDHDKFLHLAAVARYFQRMATLHSFRIGMGPDVLLPMGMTWLLHRLEIEFSRYPRLGEKVRVSTWSRGFRRFQAFREYRMASDEGVIARGTSVWIFFDYVNKRVRKVLPEVEARYSLDPEKALDTELGLWQPPNGIETDQGVDITLRYSDFDMNNHVNNTVYLGFVETLFHSIPELADHRVKNVKIRFCKEIPKQAGCIRAGAVKSDDTYLFNIREQGNAGTVYADGEFTPMVRP